jgi:hypothetical protein
LIKDELDSDGLSRRKVVWILELPNWSWEWRSD